MSETYNDNVSKPISSTVKNGGIVALAIAAGAAVAVPIAQKWEGYNGKVNRDPAGYLEQCYGDRNIDPSRIYSKDECAAKLRARMAKDYAPLILKCTPSFINAAHDPKAAQVFGSFIDASYNAGPGAVCQGLSPLVNKGNTSAACEMLPRWRVTAKGKFYPGLANRRRDEQLACLKGLT